jgi:hypothetical protein
MQGCSPCKLTGISHFVSPIGDSRKGRDAVIVDMKRIIWE